MRTLRRLYRDREQPAIHEHAHTSRGKLMLHEARSVLVGDAREVASEYARHRAQRIACPLLVGAADHHDNLAIEHGCREERRAVALREALTVAVLGH